MTDQPQDINDIAAIMQEQIAEEMIEDPYLKGFDEGWKKGFENGKNAVVEMFNQYGHIIAKRTQQ